MKYYLSCWINIYFMSGGGTCENIIGFLLWGRTICAQYRKHHVWCPLEFPFTICFAELTFISCLVAGHTIENIVNMGFYETELSQVNFCTAWCLVLNGVSIYYLSCRTIIYFMSGWPKKGGHKNIIISGMKNVKFKDCEAHDKKEFFTWFYWSWIIWINTLKKSKKEVLCEEHDLKCGA